MHDEVLELLNIHCNSFLQVKPFADRYSHPHPTDTRGWSQLLVSALTGIPGYARKKGPDLADGSDVKGANCWDAIDTPRFNNCIKAGTKAESANSLASLDNMPYLFLAMWDCDENTGSYRFRVWVVRPQKDKMFRNVASMWYEQRSEGKIMSDNFQLHPPRNKNTNVIRNNCGTLNYPLFFEAHFVGDNHVTIVYDEAVLTSGLCTVIA
jgi:hypothetical protein